jgi:L-alanine-DL-glutamate epimerase-like enolase superfamily enzyme
MEPYDLEYIEQPILTRDIDHLKALRARTRVPIIFHSFGRLAITTYAAMHVIASSSNFFLDNQTYNHKLADDVVTSPPRFANGRLSVPTAPGIGVELDRDKVARYAEAYARGGYLSAYDTEGDPFARERHTSSGGTLWFPSS